MGTYSAMFAMPDGNVKWMEWADSTVNEVSAKIKEFIKKTGAVLKLGPIFDEEEEDW